jgi:hypothetical protein
MLDSLRHLLDTAWLDVREAGRRLGRSPLFALTATLSLAVGIGANVAIFSVVNALLLRPAPGVAEPKRLVDIGRSQNGEGGAERVYGGLVSASL